MTSDHYAILGVTPTAEGVVISAAYRALIRHYHPDTNPDPEAQAKAREITAAYSVLRDPQKRADYDAQRRAEGDLWSDEERGEPVNQPRAPAMRGIGIAAALIALGLVAGVWAWPQSDRPLRPASNPQALHEPAKPVSDRTGPVVELQPESERLARLHEEAEALAPPTAIVPPTDDLIASEPVFEPPRQTRASRDELAERLSAPPRRAATSVSQMTGKPKAVAPAIAPKSERLTTLERMSSGFFVQSMANSGMARKQQLISARRRSVAQRRLCRSDTCVADAYVRQIRETSAIMEGRAGPPEVAAYRRLRAAFVRVPSTLHVPGPAAAM